MLMIGSFGRNSGKTELSCALLRPLASHQPVTAVKVTTIDPATRCPQGGKGCGVCGDFSGAYRLCDEQNAPEEKDTGRLRAAGATRVLWLQVAADRLAEGWAALRAVLTPGEAVLCEANRLAMLVEPDLLLLVRRPDERAPKPSALMVEALADQIIASNAVTDFVPQITLTAGRWQWATPTESLLGSCD
ncbi:MAG: hypothetical protein C0621_05235 [Desulfuromonas sp.]|nr:MAG: hypothetical protein C0621_05235 [Desulfuromonas sp.]